MSTAAQEKPSDKTRWGLPKRPLGSVGTRVALLVIAALFVVNYALASRSLAPPSLPRRWA